jgi:hypothetical protein
MLTFKSSGCGIQFQRVSDSSQPSVEDISNSLPTQCGEIDICDNVREFKRVRLLSLDEWEVRSLDERVLGDR